MKYPSQSNVSIGRFACFVLASVFLAFQFALPLPFVWSLFGLEAVPYDHLGAWLRMLQFFATFVWLPIAVVAVLPGFFIHMLLHRLCQNFGFGPFSSKLIVSGVLGAVGWVLFVLAIYSFNREGDIWQQFLNDSVYLLAIVPAAVVAGYLVLLRSREGRETEPQPDPAIAPDADEVGQKPSEPRGYWRPSAFRFAAFLIVSGVVATLGALVFAFAGVFGSGSSISLDKGVTLVVSALFVFPMFWLSYVFVGLLPSFAAYLGVRGLLHKLKRSKSASIVAASGCAILVCWLIGGLAQGELSDNYILHTPGWKSSIWSLLPSSMLIGLLILRRQETRRVSTEMKYEQNECT